MLGIRGLVSRQLRDTPLFVGSGVSGGSALLSRVCATKKRNEGRNRGPVESLAGEIGRRV